eukprot:1358193-Rhodomonas_salina.5
MLEVVSRKACRSACSSELTLQPPTHTHTTHAHACARSALEDACKVSAVHSASALRMRACRRTDAARGPAEVLAEAREEEERCEVSPLADVGEHVRVEELCQQRRRSSSSLAPRSSRFPRALRARARLSALVLEHVGQCCSERVDKVCELTRPRQRLSERASERKVLHCCCERG